MRKRSVVGVRSLDIPTLESGRSCLPACSDITSWFFPFGGPQKSSVDGGFLFAWLNLPSTWARQVSKDTLACWYDSIRGHSLVPAPGKYWVGRDRARLLNNVSFFLTNAFYPFFVHWLFVPWSWIHIFAKRNCFWVESCDLFGSFQFTWSGTWYLCPWRLVSRVKTIIADQYLCQPESCLLDRSMRATSDECDCACQKCMMQWWWEGEFSWLVWLWACLRWCNDHAIIGMDNWDGCY